MAPLSLAYSPDGKRLASAHSGEVKVWDAQTGQELFSIKGGVSSTADFRKCLAFSPDGERLASSFGRGGEGEVKVWDAETGLELLTVPGSGGVAFSPDGKRLASGTEGGTVTIYDATPLPEDSQAKDKAP
jgi:WD40 repeat protein